MCLYRLGPWTIRRLEGSGYYPKFPEELKQLIGRQAGGGKGNGRSPAAAPLRAPLDLPCLLPICVSVSGTHVNLRVCGDK